MTQKIDLLNGPFDSTLRRFSGPLILSFLVNMLYAWIDMFYVSRISAVSMAAVGISEQILLFSFGFGVGFGVGTSIIVARRIGEGEIASAGRITTQGIFIMFVFSIMIAVLLFFLNPLILKIMGIKGPTAILAHSYLSLMVIGLPFNFLMFQINAVVRATGNSIYPMMIMILSSILNAIFAPFLIFGLGFIPRLEIVGAGLATAIAQIIGAVISVIFMLKGNTGLKIDFSKFKIDWKVIRTIITLGIPASMQLITISINRIALSAIANMFGTHVLTTYTLGLRMDLLVSMPIFGVGTAIEITTGQNLGAKKIDRIFGFFRSAIKQLSVLMFIVGVLVFVGGAYFAKIFTNDMTLVNEISTYLHFISFSYIFLSIGIISIRVVSGAGDYTRSFLVVFIMLFAVQLPLVWLFAYYIGLKENGIWLGILISHISFALIGYYQVKAGKWLNKQV